MIRLTPDLIPTIMGLLNHYSAACWYSIPEDLRAEVRRILSGQASPTSTKHALSIVKRQDRERAHISFESVPDDNIYRVSIFPDGIDIVCFGLSRIDSDISGHYDQVDDLPNWVKERLAVLMITSSTPPTQEVAGIGRRISSHVYWVYAPERT